MIIPIFNITICFLATFNSLHQSKGYGTIILLKACVGKGFKATFSSQEGGCGGRMTSPSGKKWGENLLLFDCFGMISFWFKIGNDIFNAMASKFKGSLILLYKKAAKWVLQLQGVDIFVTC